MKPRRLFEKGSAGRWPAGFGGSPKPFPSVYFAAAVCKERSDDRSLRRAGEDRTRAACAPRANADAETIPSAEDGSAANLLTLASAALIFSVMASVALLVTILSRLKSHAKRPAIPRHPASSRFLKKN